ncbi:MAG: MBL fold metallo-hydrolase [Verrucomicrobiae bacterium]|nr:MBL fold metallo-hydrolase [Verrucomicrobiae bacterium]
MKLTFLGTGTSQGIPMIGCDCSVCTSNDPCDKRTRSSIYLETEQGCVLVDTTPDLRQQLLREKINRVDAVVYTHAHADHILGMDDLRRFCEMENRAMPLYGSREALETLSRVFFYAFNGENRFKGYVHPEPHAVQGPFELCGLTWNPLEVPHGKVRTWGYRVDYQGVPKLAYFSDCKSLPESVISQIQQIPYLILDGLRFKSHPTHLSLPEAIETARQVGAHATYFTHLAHAISHAEVGETLPSKMFLAHDGLKLEIL